MPDINVQVTEPAWEDDSEDPQSMVRRVAGALESCLGKALPGGELTVRFASDADVRALNTQFRGREAPTNVLSFPATPVPGSEDPELGDVILARETVAREASEQGKALAAHTCHLILHGILHLLEYDHDTDERAEEMEALEREVLKTMGIGDPYAERDLTEVGHGV